MKLTIFAATGGIGRQILEQAAGAGHDVTAVVRDPAPAPATYPRKELIRRLRKRECELCETGTTVTVHQVASLKTLGRPEAGQPAWAGLMARMHRKTLIVCAECHDWIHANPVTHAA